MAKTKRCSHCTGAMVLHMKGPEVCINCGREEIHYKSGGGTCKNCTARPIERYQEEKNELFSMSIV